MIHELPGGLAMYYELHGAKDADSTIVFLNGLSQSTASWLGIAPQFYSAHRVLLCDLIFQGRAQPSGYTEPILHSRRLLRKHEQRTNQ